MFVAAVAAVAGVAVGEAVPLRAVIDTTGVDHAYAEIFFLGHCASAPAAPAVVTFTGAHRSRRLRIGDPCRGRWRVGGGARLTALAITPHPSEGSTAASIEFGAFARHPARGVYHLSIAYRKQALRATVSVAVARDTHTGMLAYSLAVTRG